MHKHQIAAAFILAGLAAIPAAYPGPQTAPPLPARFAAAPAKAAADQLPPQSGIVYQVHFFAPGGPTGKLDISLENGAGRQWHIVLRPWDAGAQMSWNGAPVTVDIVVGNLARAKAN